MKYFLLLCLLLGSKSLAQDSFLEEGTSNKTIPELEGVGVEEHLGENIDLSLTFNDEEGKEVALSKYVNGKKPVLFTLIYYSCPALCNFHLNGLTEVFKNLPELTVGKDFDVVAISINPNETPEVAKKKRAAYVKEYGRSSEEGGWHFLTGKQENITKIAEQFGFKYKWVEETKEFAHTAVAYILTPEGKISRYMYGIGFAPKTLRLSFVEASDGKVGSVIDKFILHCFRYDPDKKTYAFYAYNIMRAGAGGVAVFLLFFMGSFWRRQKKKNVG